MYLSTRGSDLVCMPGLRSLLGGGRGGMSRGRYTTEGDYIYQWMRELYWRYTSVAGMPEGIGRFTRGLIGGRVGIHVYSPQQPHQILALPGYWHLVAATTTRLVGKRVVSMLQECLLFVSDFYFLRKLIGNKSRQILKYSSFVTEIDGLVGQNNSFFIWTRINNTVFTQNSKEYFSLSSLYERGFLLTNRINLGTELNKIYWLSWSCLRSADLFTLTRCY